MQKYVVCLLLAVLCGQLLSAPVYAAKACASSDIVGGAKSAAKQAARKAAVQDWRNRAALARGPIWSNWSVAANRQVDCRAAGGAVQCRARARPCKELGSASGQSGGKYKLVK